MNEKGNFLFNNYLKNLNQILNNLDLEPITKFAIVLKEIWLKGNQLFICGNGGSAGNAIHIANDFIYGIANKSNGLGLKVHALSSNPSIITCLANDLSYDDIFSHQLQVLGNKDDVLLALSGSGNSPNIVKSIEIAKKKGIQTFAILGYTGGKCKEMVDTSIHIPIMDMQISEDLQLIICHMAMQWLRDNIK